MNCWIIFNHESTKYTHTHTHIFITNCLCEMKLSHLHHVDFSECEKTNLSSVWPLWSCDSVWLGLKLFRMELDNYMASSPAYSVYNVHIYNVKKHLQKCILKLKMYKSLAVLWLMLLKVYNSVCFLIRLCVCVFCADSSHSSNSTKGERLSAKMRSLPGSNEPYEASSPKEIGEET